MMREHLGTPEHMGRCSSETRGNPGLHTENTGNTSKTIGSGLRTIRLPLFGLCNLRPHDMGEAPFGLLGYVEFADKPGALHVAVLQDGEWRDRGLRAFKSDIARWYSLEHQDGSPVLGH